MKILAILGPTASGKSNLAIRIAAKIDGEILSCDSMMVYRDMDIGTAKPSKKDRDLVRHYLVDVVDISQRYNVGLFVEDAKASLNTLIKKGKIPLLCGGTGLYAKAFLFGYGFCPRDPSIVEEIENSIESGDQEKLVEELKNVDPQLAEKARGNPRRLIRALEIVRLTGKSPEELLSNSSKNAKFEHIQCIMMPESNLLRKRIQGRVKQMLKNGWIEETKELIKFGLQSAPTASKALGYAQIMEYLNGRIASTTELAEIITLRTCQFAKKQRTWYRNQHPDAIYMEFDSKIKEKELAEKIIRIYRSSSL